MYPDTTPDNSLSLEDSMVRGVVRVVSVQDDSVWVVSENQSACGGCSQAKACGTKTLAGFFSKRMAPLSMDNNFHGLVGDRIEVGMRNSTILKVSALIYMLPLLAMFIGAVLGSALNMGDGIAMLISLAALISGVLVSRSIYVSARFSAVVVPIYLRKLLPQETIAANGTRRSTYMSQGDDVTTTHTEKTKA